ncbi:ABC transporter substrate-binding protein [Aliiroseovarius subalbicans]|uniref:ABC transporter substrate-binding protein n=1 Tax=Aliiroseovarius subalbicans TaxID=2925840 RepID=UPI001F577089|nr:ABC transporter substrate-binding protein [Aliiroseovarius subalbicans]MCI2399232.1 ABC transporter substrate-binding protein [Aliiroseovarius subalbicans]
MNLCTDQLAMLLASPGQLISISNIASDPLVSAMVDEAATYPMNFGRAEEIYLLAPDLVLAGQYSRGNAVEMLERLGVPVLRLPFAQSMQDVAANMRTIGAALGRDRVGEEMAATFETRLTTLREDVATPLTAALYSANGYTTGEHSLSGQILLAAGFENIATRAGIPYGGVLPMELLIMAEPDLVITSQPYPGASRSEDILKHPAIATLRSHQRRATMSDQQWVCGTPHVLAAVESLVADRRALQEASE